MNTKLFLIHLFAAVFSFILMALAPWLVRRYEGRSPIVFLCRKVLPGALGICGMLMLVVALFDLAKALGGSL